MRLPVLWASGKAIRSRADGVPALRLGQRLNAIDFSRPVSAQIAAARRRRGELVIAPRMVRRIRPDRVERTSAFRLQLIRSPGFHRPIGACRDLRRQKTSVQQRSSKRARPVSKTVPADLRKILTECRDIGVGADAVESIPNMIATSSLCWRAAAGSVDPIVLPSPICARAVPLLPGLPRLLKFGDDVPPD